MKQYQKKRDLSSERPATQTLPVMPDFAAGDPSVGELVYRWFDQNGNYLGWTGYDTGRKFLLGKLYYKTKGAYKIRTSNSYSNRNAKKICIREKDTHNLAAYAVRRTIEDKDLIDIDDKKALLKITLDGIQNHGFNAWNYTNFPDKYKMIPNAVREQLNTHMANCMKQMKLELENYINGQINDIQNAEVVASRATNATKGKWNFGGAIAS